MVTNRYVVLGVVTADHWENPKDTVSLKRKTALKGRVAFYRHGAQITSSRRTQIKPFVLIYFYVDQLHSY